MLTSFDHYLIFAIVFQNVVIEAVKSKGGSAGYSGMHTCMYVSTVLSQSILFIYMSRLDPILDLTWFLLWFWLLRSADYLWIIMDYWLHVFDICWDLD